MNGSNHESCVSVCIYGCVCACVFVCVWEVEVSQMAPKGFSLIVPSPGIRPLGLVASTAFDVTTKSNHFYNGGPWIQTHKENPPRRSSMSLLCRTTTRQTTESLNLNLNLKCRLQKLCVTQNWNHIMRVYFLFPFMYCLTLKVNKWGFKHTIRMPWKSSADKMTPLNWHDLRYAVNIRSVSSILHS